MINWDFLYNNKATEGQFAQIERLLYHANLPPHHIELIDREYYHYTYEEAEQQIIYLSQNQTDFKDRENLSQKQIQTILNRIEEDETK